VTPYHAFHLNFLKLTYNNLIKQEPFNFEEPNAADMEFLERYRNLVEDVVRQEEHIYEDGQHLMLHLVRAYPHLVPLIPRDLLWYFGGDCLHYMPDEEIALYQRLDEMRHDAEQSGDENFRYEEARANLLGLN